MAKKLNIDFKKIILEKGERIGLGIALGFMVILLILGAWSGLGKKSPLGTLRDNTESLNTKIANATFIPDPTMPEGAPLATGHDFDPEEFKIGPITQPISPEDTKKRNPAILGLAAYQVQLLRVPIRVIEKTEKQVQIIVPKGGAQEGQKYDYAEKIRPTRMVVVSATFPYAQQLELYRQALRATTVKDLKELPQFLGLYIYRRTMLPNGKLYTEKDGDKDIEWFPLVDKKQADGMPRIQSLLSISPDIQPEDAKQKEYVMPGLTMPRPVLAGVATYPPLRKLKGIPDGADPKPLAATASSAGADAKVVGTNIEDLPEEYKNRLNGVGINVFDPFNPFGKKDGKASGTFTQKTCLCRFIDIDVEPGHTYDYTVIIRAANPNKDKLDDVAAEKYALAPELLSNYNFIPHVQIPYDTELYVADEAAMDKLYNKANAMVGAELPKASQTRVAVQIHRWVDRIKNQVNAQGFDVGEWLIAERLLVRRGEFLGHDVSVDVPKWNQVLKIHELALQNVKGKGVKAAPATKGLMVDFSVKTDLKLPPALLIDFNGGTQPGYPVFSNGKSKFMTADESAADLLILSPEGKLAVQNGVIDTDSESPIGKARLERYESWRSRVGKLKPQKDTGKKPEDIFGNNK